MVTVAKVAMRINHIAADELHLIRKILALLDHDHVQDQNLEVAREAARVHVHVHVRVPLLVRDYGHVLDLDPPLDPGPEAFRDQEAARHPGQDQARPKAGQDRGRARVKAAHDQGLTVAREEADRRQDQVQEKAIPGRDRQLVQGKACRVQGPDLKAALVRARRTVGQEARVDRDLNPSLSRDLNQDREAAANRDRDRVPDQRAVLEVGVRADRRGKCTLFI